MSDRHSAAKILGDDTLAETVGELIELLQRLPPTTSVRTIDADMGGYDVCTNGYVHLSAHDNCVTFGHLEYKAYEAYQGGLLKREEYEELAK